MSADDPTIILFRARIQSLKATGIAKIWMTPIGPGHFRMANLLGFFDSYLILILKASNLIKFGILITRSIIRKRGPAK